MKTRYRLGTGRQRLIRNAWLTVLLGVILAGLAFAAYQVAYNRGLAAVSDNPKTQIVTITKGESVQEIATELEEVKLIRSGWAFQLYVRKKGVADTLQAGTYALAPNQDVPAIVKTLSRGDVATSLVTILPGRRIDQVRADFINAGFSPQAVDAALDPTQYNDIPLLAAKPAEVQSLEGLLWPESYQKLPTTEPATVIRAALLAMNEQITPDVQAAFGAQGLSTYQGIILTSILTQELSKPADLAQASQVFLKRLKSGVALGSDPTAKYGAILAGQSPSLTYESPYNTYTNKGLPPTPIGTVTAQALYAATNPANTDWLYFVSGDDGTTYFSKTLQEHEALTEKHCTELC